LDWATGRVRNAESELDRFCGYADLDDPRHQRTHLKLRNDVANAQRDAAWFQHQLDAALAVAGVDV
jgi:hypothetical protein